MRERRVHIDVGNPVNQITRATFDLFGVEVRLKLAILLFLISQDENVEEIFGFASKLCYRSEFNITTNNTQLYKSLTLAGKPQNFNKLIILTLKSLSRGIACLRIPPSTSASCMYTYSSQWKAQIF